MKTLKRYSYFLLSIKKGKEGGKRGSKRSIKMKPAMTLQAQVTNEATTVHTNTYAANKSFSSYAFFPLGFFCYEHINNANKAAAATPSTNEDSKGPLSARGRALD